VMGGQKSSHVDASLPVLTSVLDRFEGSLHEHSLGQIFAHRPSGSTGCHTYIQGVVCMMMAASANHQTSLQDERVHDEKVLFGLSMHVESLRSRGVSFYYPYRSRLLHRDYRGFLSRSRYAIVVVFSFLELHKAQTPSVVDKVVL
jgi:hypothetical protein